MKLITKKNAFFIVTLIITVLCFSLTLTFSGIHHEDMKMTSIIVSLFIVIACIFLINDTIKFVLVAIDTAIWPRPHNAFTTDEGATIHSRKDYLKLRLDTLKSQLVITEEHRNESLNLKYQLIAIDLWLYGKYFILLTCTVLVTKDELLYYNTNSLEKLFFRNQTYSLGLSTVLNLDHLYLFIESTLIYPFEPNTSETGQITWLYGDHTAKLGVIRLRQLRRAENTHIGWEPTKFSNLDYMENWELPHQRMPYTNKYWRIYEPWLPMAGKIKATEKMFLNFNHDGYFQKYPELEGYVTLLARSSNNSMIILEYLQKHNWLTVNTSALFMDFTLYNADANFFTICTLHVEQTPFGTFVPQTEITTVQLLVFDKLGRLGIFVAIVYMLVLIQFAKSLVVTLWYEPSKLNSMWNKLDLIILILNITVLCLIITREIMVTSLLRKVEAASKLQFLDFRRPARLHVLTNIMIGFLICMTTLRLWKVLQFASVFQLFSNTLYTAWTALASTAILILIFLIGFGIAVVIINGNNTSNFTHVEKSVISSLCFSFGFSSHISPTDLFYGGRVIGLVLYLVLAFVVSQLLINVFVSTINDYFTRAKALRDSRYEHHINFLQFMQVEYAKFFGLFKICNRGYRRHNRTVAQNVKLKLDGQKKTSGGKSRYMALSTASPTTIGQSKANEMSKQEQYIKRVARLYTIAAIMQTQMELLEHILFTDEFDEEAEDEAEGEDSETEYV